MPSRTQRSPMWTAHEEPERKPAYGMWICSCEPCRMVLRAEVALRPRTPFVLKTRMDRVMVTAELLLETWEHDVELESLLHCPDDYVREVFVASRSMLVGRARWWSQTEHELCLWQGILTPRRTEPCKQTEEARRRHAEAWQDPDRMIALRGW